MAVIEIARIQVRRGQESVTGIPQLASGEFGWAEDTEHLYIGKRIVDGAQDDNNTRVLTENDIVNVFAMITPGSAVSSTSSYRYRDSLPDLAFPSVAALAGNYNTRPYITMGSKFDQLTVSLADFVPNWPPASNDITDVTNAVLHDLYINTFTNMQRTLKIPAGSYTVSDVIKLPPNTRLIGEGKEMTKLRLINDSVNLMQTVDSRGNTFANMTNNRDVNPVNIHISDMTLQFNTGTVSTLSLLSLDNTRNSVVKSVGFSSNNSTSTGFTNIVANATTASGSASNVFVAGTATYPSLVGLASKGLYYIVGSSKYSTVAVPVVSFSYGGGFFTAVTTSSASGSFIDFKSSPTELYSLYKFDGGGTGITIKTLDNGSANANANNIAYSDNTDITGCDFNNLEYGIIGTSSTFNINVSNNVFSNSFNGVKLYTDSSYVLHNGPLNSKITRNTFETIFKNGIYVGSNPNNLPSNTISLNNYFTQVGNGAEQALLGVTDSTVNRKAYPVIQFNSQGNITTNDYFNRKQVASTATTVWFNQSVAGPTNIQDQAARLVAVPSSAVTNVVNFPLTGTEQSIDVKYQMSNSYLSRKGVISLNIRSDATSASAASISDTYNYTEDQTQYDPTTNSLTAANGSGLDSLLIDASGNQPLITILHGLSGSLTGGNSTLYFTGSSTYLGLASFVVAVAELSTSSFQIVTQSSNPQFNYDPVTYPSERWTMLSADTPVFGVRVATTANYVTLYCDTTTASAGSTFNVTYQTNTFQQ